MVVALLCWLLFTAVPLLAQGVDLTLGEPDTSAFPTVRVNMRAVNAAGTPLTTAELSNLRLRENGVPISDFDVRYVPVGSDIVFVIDADETLLLTDGDEVSRLDEVKEIIGRYATRFMSPSGLDRVSVIVPNRTNTRSEFLVRDATTPEEVINALAAYEPQTLAENGPVNQQILDAVDHITELNDNGRYQSIFLLSEARRLNEFLDYPALTAAAQAANVPVFVGILGPEASLEDIGNASALAGPTGGLHVHVPRPERADAIFLRWQQEGNRPQISYRSLLRSSGVYPLTVNLGTVTAVTDMNLTIEPPTAAIALGRTIIRRVGTAEDTPLTELQPTSQPVPVQIEWPDGRARRLAEVAFRVNGVLQPQLTTPQPDETGLLRLDWPVQNADVGVYELAVTVTDELGYTAVSDPVIVTVVVERPLPPTPVPAPTPTPPPVAQMADELTALPQSTLLLILAGLGLIGLLLVMLRVYRRYRERVLLDTARAGRRAAWQQAQADKEADAADEEPLPLTLLWLDEAAAVKQEFAIEPDTVTLGRAEMAGQITLADRSVSLLHARVRWRNGRYWLYDEGSENGVFLNHERLGLSPRPLADGDLIQLGRISLRARIGEQEEGEQVKG
ncbi:MAG TPA: FHA domain-containing protein [Chloroflexota bacterium]|nr:FHA domain-containing protein [Chloroflexota bacterium]